jgi:hypothetical protein
LAWNRQRNRRASREATLGASQTRTNRRGKRRANQPRTHSEPARKSSTGYQGNFEPRKDEPGTQREPNTLATCPTRNRLRAKSQAAKLPRTGGGPTENQPRTHSEPAANRQRTARRQEAKQRRARNTQQARCRASREALAASQQRTSLTCEPRRIKLKREPATDSRVPKMPSRRNTEQLRSKLGTRSEPDEPDAATVNPTGTRSRPTAIREPALNHPGTNREPTANQPQNRPEPTANQLRTSCVPAANHRHIWSLGAWGTCCKPDEPATKPP